MTVIVTFIIVLLTFSSDAFHCSKHMFIIRYAWLYIISTHIISLSFIESVNNSPKPPIIIQIQLKTSHAGVPWKQSCYTGSFSGLSVVSFSSYSLSPPQSSTAQSLFTPRTPLHSLSLSFPLHINATHTIIKTFNTTSHRTRRCTLAFEIEPLNPYISVKFRTQLLINHSINGRDFAAPLQVINHSVKGQACYSAHVQFKGIQYLQQGLQHHTGHAQ